MNSFIGPLLIPPRLAMRALDDLHALAQSGQKLADAVSELPKIERRIRERLDALDESLGGVARVGEDMRRTVEAMRSLQEAVLVLITSTDALAVAIQPLESIGRRVGRFAERFPGRRESAPESRVDPG